MVIHLPRLLVLFKGQQPSRGASVHSLLVPPSVNHSVVAQQKIVSVNFGVFAKAFQTQSQFLPELAQQANSWKTSCRASVRPNGKEIDTAGFRFWTGLAEGVNFFK